MARRTGRRVLLGSVLFGSVLAGCTSIYQVRGVEDEPPSTVKSETEYFFPLDELEHASPNLNLNPNANACSAPDHEPEPPVCDPISDSGLLPGRCLPDILKDIEARSVEPLELCESGRRRCFDRCSATCWEPSKSLPSSAAGSRKCAPGTDGSDPPGYQRFQPRRFKIGILEVNRDGSLSPKQKAGVFEMLDSEAKAAREAEQNLIILLFIHGWHHGAGVCDTNLACFRRLVGGMANVFGAPEDAGGRPGTTSSTGGAPPGGSSRFVGIYFAWRGESIEKEKSFLSWLTIWKRKSVAQDIGRSGGTNLLLELDGLYWRLKREAANYRRDEISAPSKVIMVSAGHSLGGAMLLSALSSKLVGHVGDHRFVRASEPYRDQHAMFMPRISGFGDLSILLNPAVEAARYEVFHRNLEAVLDEGWSYSPDQMPVLLAMTSTADKSNRFGFPVHRFLMPAKERLALGHYKPFRTHALESNIQRRELECIPMCGCPGYVAGEFLPGGRAGEARQSLLNAKGKPFGDRLQAELDRLDEVLTTEATPGQLTADGAASACACEPGERCNKRRSAPSKESRRKIDECEADAGGSAPTASSSPKPAFCLRAKEPKKWKPNSPFWVIRTGESVIQGHNDLWDRSLQTFLGAFIQVFLEMGLEKKSENRPTEARPPSALAASGSPS